MIVEIHYKAKCKHCKWIKEWHPNPNKLWFKRHKCNNTESSYFNSQVTLKDRICNKFKL